MKRAAIAVLAVVFVAAVLGFAIATDKSQVYNVCNCIPDCKCNSFSKEPGKCTCGKEMKKVI